MKPECLQMYSTGVILCLRLNTVQIWSFSSVFFQGTVATKHSKTHTDTITTHSHNCPHFHPFHLSFVISMLIKFCSLSLPLCGIFSTIGH